MYVSVKEFTLAHSSHANLFSPSSTSTVVNFLKQSMIDVLATGFRSPFRLKVRDKLVLRNNGDAFGDEARA